MTTDQLVLLGFDLAMAGLEKWIIDGEMAKLRGEGKSDKEISERLKEMLAQEITAAKADSAAKRLSGK